MLLAFTVVVFGAYVRLTAAGLGCPDWPGCYGHVTPLGAEDSIVSGASLAGPPLDVGKAWREMIHRYLAGALVLLIVLMAALSCTQRFSRLRRRYAFTLLATIVAQAALGMLTVRWQLKPLIVTLHLVIGLSTLSLVWLLWLTLRSEGRGVERSRGAERRNVAGGTERPARILATFALVTVAAQITLGGWTSSNYAAIACPDFPRCQGSWWPAMDGHAAFVLWRTPTVNYEGGLLSLAARSAIHFTHRLGAAAAACVLLLAALYVLCQRRLRPMHAAAIFVVLALALQLTIGISMVLRGFPLWLAAAHNAGAALTLLAVVTLVYRANELVPQSVRVPRRSDSRGTFAIPAAEPIPRAAMARANGFAAEVAGVATGSTAHGPTSFN